MVQPPHDDRLHSPVHQQPAGGRFRDRSAEGTIKHDIQFGLVLRAWMLQYAEWLIASPEPATIRSRRSRLSTLAGTKLGANALLALETRPDFVAYLDTLRKGPLEAAKARYLSRVPKYVEHYDTAIEGLVQQQEWKAVTLALEPTLERLVPKRGGDTAAVQVNVTLSPERLTAFTEYAPLDVEVVPLALPAPAEVEPAE